MGFISRRLLPDCGNMCLCCPALRPSSQQPVKRYKKLLSEIFPKTVGSPPNERKILKLCEYAAKNPFRIPKIAKILEQRSYKELRNGHVSSIKIITEAYCKLLYICKEQMACFAGSLLNVICELLDNKYQSTTRILGCQTLTRFIYSQADNTYARKIENIVHKVCMLACGTQEEQKNILRAASLQCLSAMVWYMTAYSFIFADFDEVIHATLENYGADEHIENSDERHESHHNWVDEVVRSEVRGGASVVNDVGFSNVTIRQQPGTKDSSLLTREERESPQVWSQICIQKFADLARESTTMRRVLDPMFIYFDTGRHWVSRHGLAFCVLSDFCYLVKNSGNEQFVLAAIVRHLDHKNVVHDPQTKSDIVQVATALIRQLRSQAVVAEIGVASDLCRHLRKSLQATGEYVGPQQSNWNASLQTSIEDCLLEISKGTSDSRLLFDMMATTMEKLPAAAIVARATIESLLILADIISLTSIHSHSQLVFPETLLLQLLKTMVHPDIETRITAHKIFSVILVRMPNRTKHEADHLFETWKLRSKTTSVFASATALLEKLRREKECSSADKHENDIYDVISVKNVDEELKHGWIQKGSPYFYKLSSVIDRTATASRSDEVEANITVLTEDQTAQLLSSLWMQAIQPDNLPSNFEAIAHSFSLTLLSSRTKTSNNSNTVRFFQLPLSLISMSLNTNSILPPSCQRSVLTLATGMLAFAGKLYHISELTDSLMSLIPYDADPYLRIGDDLQICIKIQSDLQEYGSHIDQQAAESSLADSRKKVADFVQWILDILARYISNLTDLDIDDVIKQLSEIFIPEDVLLFGPKQIHEWVNISDFASSEDSLSPDEERSRSLSMDGDEISVSVASEFPRFTSRMPLPHVLSVGQLLESALHVAGQVAGTCVSTSPLPYGTMASQCEALDMGMRKKLSTWLVTGHDPIPDDQLPTILVTHQPSSGKVDSEQERSTMSEPRLTLRLPPASPFDNFMKAAGC